MDNGMEETGSDASRITGFARSSSHAKGKEGGSLFSVSTLSVWTGIVLLCVILAFGYRQIRGWVEGLQAELSKVAQDNKLLLDGLDELLARTDALDRVAETEFSPPIQTAQERPVPETAASSDITTRYKIYYRTKEGEDLAEIGRKFGVTEDELRLWNALGPADFLIPGQVVVINKKTDMDKPTDAARIFPPPDAGAMAAAPGQPVAERPPSPDIPTYRHAPEDLASDEGIPDMDEAPVPEGDKITAKREFQTPREPVEEIVHTIQAGETLSELGQEFGVPWPILAAYNRIADPETLYEGQRLRIPIHDGAPVSPAPTSEMIHIVRRGENLYRIGLKYGVRWETIAHRNNIGDNRLLYEGQVLKIPVAMGGPEP